LKLTNVLKSQHKLIEQIYHFSMNLFQSSLLFLSTTLGSLIGLLIPNLSKEKFKTILTFTGGYLLSIVIVHILPETFNSSNKHNSIYILAGFFIQLLLELSTKGLEHGHIHTTNTQNKLNFITLFLALFIHSLSDGSILAHPHTATCTHSKHTHFPLLIGIVMHKIPVAFTLTIMMLSLQYKIKHILIIIFVFALSSPIGMLTVQYLYNNSILNTEQLKSLSALISGSFLYISTTIFFEHTPNHNFDIKKILASLSGAGLALATEYIN
jgi:zinc and cadmium transporter